MGRIVFGAFLLLGGCASAATVAAVPGTLIGGVVDFFKSQEESLPVNMQYSLASVQQGLRQMDLDVDVLEPVGEGYAIGFGNARIDGRMGLKRQTPMLTTVSIIVHRGVGRQHSVEQAILNVVEKVSERGDTHKTFNFRGYHNVRARPLIRSPRVGWYRPGALLAVSKSRKDGWLKIKMPSGKRAYLKGKLSKKHSLK